VPSIFENDDEFIIDEFEYIPSEGKTLYASFGAAIPWIFLGITVLFLIIAFKYGNNKRYIPVDKEKFLTGQKNNTK
jgi:hypothetical protein